MRTHLIDYLARQGTTFTVDDVVRLGTLSRNVAHVLLSRLEKQGWIERIERGTYLIIPLGAEQGGYTLHEFVIGSLLVRPCTIAYWSALHYHGLTEQIPHTVFVQTTSRKRVTEKQVFGIRYRFVRVGEGKFFGSNEEWIENSKVTVTDREKTIVDCLDKPQYCGGIIEAAKGLRASGIDINTMIDYARRMDNSAILRRMGFLCDRLGIEHSVLRPDTRNYLWLDPTMPHHGKPNAKWRLNDNLQDEHWEALE